ncbi:hypothetical protein CDL12_22773 [Handroanthus impetiginosus]|uniref:Uncharacterized protein n=1 Tax=Handroanthus impetiginosus TaxID=429701 RepID=A0A2G9GHB7_9LAMI|nr:hypothetical protein CDL12_22773 [Handroanthus impetiginosus]
MPGTTCLRRGVINLSPTLSSKGRWVSTITPRKQTDESAGDAGVEKEKAEPIVAISRPPPLPPFIGPLVALSMLDAWTKRDNSDD